MLKPLSTTSSSFNYQLLDPETSNRTSSRSSDGGADQIVMAVSFFRHRRFGKAFMVIALLICLLVVPLISLLHSLQNDISRYKLELEQLKLSVESAKVAQREAIRRNSPEVALPRKLDPNALPSEMPAIVSQERTQLCQMHNCFDHSRCSFTSGLPIYFYDPDEFNILREGYDLEEFLKASIKEAFKNNPHTVIEPKEACIYLVLVNDAIDLAKLYGLPFWAGDGRNHVLLNLQRSNLNSNATNGLHQKNTMRSIIVQSSFERSQFRLNYDLIVPPILGPSNGDVWQECTPMVPARRKYLLSYQGELRPNIEPFESPLLDDFILDLLMNMSNGHTKDHFLLQFECDSSTEEQDMEENSITNLDLALCGTNSARKSILENSTFVLILTSDDQRISSVRMLARLYEALRCGAIPVIVGADQIHLPFEETIDWRRVALLLPKARITELHFLLRAVQDNDLLLMRRQGRLIWERYLSSVQATLDTVIASLRDRLGIPPRPVSPIIAKSLFNDKIVQLKSPPKVVIDTQTPEKLGPIRQPLFPSPVFQRNYTILRTQSHDAWNDWMNPFYLYPQLPFDPVLPSEAKFLGSDMGFRPVASGGSGIEFSKVLGGNYPYEQFTIVILTYEREKTLIQTLNKLHRLPYLQKVIVIWNSPKTPSLSWPEIDVPIEVVRGVGNSLNNRFLPFDIIETEAVLSLDDDIQLTHDKIIFAFRVWREHRDRLVGFPARVHDWKQSTKWLYNAEHSCELSMVLTGAAFVHKYYLFVYTYDMPQAIRDKVDEYMNCEDIALNFLISHITRQPPVKVTSLRNFECESCPTSLSTDNSHYEERNECVNFFTRVFGYNPLLNSQYRADSILYNIKMPNYDQKCFRYV